MFLEQQFVDEINNSVEDHASCDPNECESHPAFYLLLYVDPENPSMLNVHTAGQGINVQRVIDTMIETIDDMAVRSKPDDMPKTIAVARGREYIRKRTQEVPVSESVSNELDDIIQAIIAEQEREENDD